MELGYLDRPAFELLQSTILSDLQTLNQDLIMVDSESNVGDALNLLAKYHISAAPVFDRKHQTIIGAISTLDVVVWVVRTYAIAKNECENQQYITFDRTRLSTEFNAPVGRAMTWGLDPFWGIPGYESADWAISNFFKWRFHRLPVVDNDNHVTGIVSQSDIVRFLHNNSKHLSNMMKRTLRELGLEFGGVVSVNVREPLIKAFSCISDTQYTGIAIVDDQGRLVSNISASDLKGITDENFPQLNESLSNFISSPNKIPPIKCTPDSTLGELIQKLVENRIHRVYIVDDDDTLLNVVTLTTVMQLFSSPSLPNPEVERPNLNPVASISQ